MQPLTDRKLNRASEHAGIDRVAINDSVDLYPANVWAVDLELALAETSNCWKTPESLRSRLRTLSRSTPIVLLLRCRINLED